MVEYKYFDRVYKDVTKKIIQIVSFSLKMIGMTMDIISLSMFTTMTKIVMKGTQVDIEFMNLKQSNKRMITK